MTVSASDDDRQIKPFADFIGEQQVLAGQLAITLNALIQAVDDTGKGGSMALTIKVKPVTKGNGSQLLVTCDVTSKAPKPEAEPRVYFVTDDFNLSRSDPHQQVLPLREVPRNEEAPRTIPTASGGNQ